MKKIFSILILAVILMACFCITVSAESSSGNTAETVLDRIFEWWTANRTDILASTSWIGTFALCLVTKKAQKKPLADLATTAGMSNQKSDNLIRSYNELVEAYNKQSAEFENIKNELTELKRDVLDTEKIESRIAKILQTVYANSSALPQGVKDIISLDCAECMTIAIRDIEKGGLTDDKVGEGESA